MYVVVTLMSSDFLVSALFNSIPQTTTQRSTLNLIKLKVRSYIKRYPVLGLFKAPTHPAVYSFQRQLNFSGRHTATLQLLCGGYFFVHPPLPLAYYSFVRLNELEQTCSERNCPSFETAARVFQPGFSRLRVRCFNLRAPTLNCFC